MYWHTLTIGFVGCGCLVIWFGVIYVSCSFGGLHSRVDGLNLWLRLLLGLQGLGFVFGRCLLRLPTCWLSFWVMWVVNSVGKFL